MRILILGNITICQIGDVAMSPATQSSFMAGEKLPDVYQKQSQRPTRIQRRLGLKHTYVYFNEQCVRQPRGIFIFHMLLECNFIIFWKISRQIRLSKSKTELQPPFWNFMLFAETYRYKYTTSETSHRWNEFSNVIVLILSCHCVTFITVIFILIGVAMVTKFCW